MAEEDVLVLKILLVGDPGCGKTSLIRRYVDNSFTGSEQPTIGMDFSLKEVVLAGQRVKVQLWDIGGQDHSAANLSRVYFRGSVGAFIVYDISRPSTFDGATTWKEALDERVTLPNGKPLPVILIGNKKDLEPSLAQIHKRKGIYRVERHKREGRRGPRLWFGPHVAAGARLGPRQYLWEARGGVVSCSAGGGQQRRRREGGRGRRGRHDLAQRQ